MNNKEKLEQLNKLDSTKITNIEMTSIGLLDTFGKLNIQIHIGDVIKTLEFISPVPKQEIINWLQKDNLIDKATLIQF